MRIRGKTSRFSLTLLPWTLATLPFSAASDEHSPAIEQRSVKLDLEEFKESNGKPSFRVWFKGVAF